MLELNDYVLITNGYGHSHSHGQGQGQGQGHNQSIGQIVQIIWNSFGFIVKLFNDPNYVDPFVTQYKHFFPDGNTRGLKLITYNDHVQKLSLEQVKTHWTHITNIVTNTKISNVETLEKINNGWNKLFSKTDVRTTQSVHKPAPVQAQTQAYTQVLTKQSDLPNTAYVTNQIILWKEDFVIGSNSIEILGESNIQDVVKPALLKILEQFDPINTDYYYDFESTVEYQHMMSDHEIDFVGIGRGMIQKIKNSLLSVQQSVVIDEESGYKMLDSTNIFDFIDFKIVGNHIQISNVRRAEPKQLTESLVPNLQSLKGQYGAPINYYLLSNLLFNGVTESDHEMYVEGIRIISQEYTGVVQVKPNYLIWVLNRLIICWYAQPYLYENVESISVCINLFRTKEEMGGEPMIMLNCNYGKDTMRKIMSYLGYYFFPYKRLGTGQTVMWCENIDGMLYCSNGSIEFKRYIEVVKGIDVRFDNFFEDEVYKQMDLSIEYGV